ncbi:MAG: DUF11 domain-containing protein [Clostridiales bacterium]|jgi:uncharacterized repeat protein (TIGR01451 family)|nr:DUF11 domain-containing protein [Clostridiales bacterium]
MKKIMQRVKSTKRYIKTIPIQRKVTVLVLVLLIAVSSVMIFNTKDTWAVSDPTIAYSTDAAHTITGNTVAPAFITGNTPYLLQTVITIPGAIDPTELVNPMLVFYLYDKNSPIGDYLNETEAENAFNCSGLPSSLCPDGRQVGVMTASAGAGLFGSPYTAYSLTNLHAGTTLNVPIKIRMNSPNVPISDEYAIVAMLYYGGNSTSDYHPENLNQDSGGNMIVPLPSSNTELVFTYTQKEPSMTTSIAPNTYYIVPGNTASGIPYDGYFRLPAGVETDGDTWIDDSSEINNTMTFDVETVGQAGYRGYDSVTITVTLPPYVTLSGIAYPVIDPAQNPGWTINNTDHTAIYTNEPYSATGAYQGLVFSLPGISTTEYEGTTTPADIWYTGKTIFGKATDETAVSTPLNFDVTTVFNLTNPQGPYGDFGDKVVATNSVLPVKTLVISSNPNLMVDTYSAPLSRYVFGDPDNLPVYRQSDMVRPNSTTFINGFFWFGDQMFNSGCALTNQFTFIDDHLDDGQTYLGMTPQEAWSDGTWPDLVEHDMLQFSKVFFITPVGQDDITLYYRIHGTTDWVQFPYVFNSADFTYAPNGQPQNATDSIRALFGDCCNGFDAGWWNVDDGGDAPGQLANAAHPVQFSEVWDLQSYLNLPEGEYIDGLKFTSPSMAAASNITMAVGCTLIPGAAETISADPGATTALYNSASGNYINDNGETIPINMNAAAVHQIIPYAPELYATDLNVDNGARPADPPLMFTGDSDTINAQISLQHADPFRAPFDLNNAQLIQLVPKGVTFTGLQGSWVSTTNPDGTQWGEQFLVNQTPTVVPNWQGTGRTAWIWDLQGQMSIAMDDGSGTGSDSGTPLSINIGYQIESNCTPGINTIHAFLLWHDNGYVAVNIGYDFWPGIAGGATESWPDMDVVPNPSDVDNSLGADALMLQDYEQFDFLAPDVVSASKLAMGSYDTDYSNTGTGMPDTPASYKLTVVNDSSQNITNMNAVDVLPYPGDKTLNTQNGTAFGERGSTIYTPMTGPVLNPDPLKFTVFYTTMSIPSNWSGVAAFDASVTAASGWVTDISVADWSKVTAFKIQLNTNQILPINSAESPYEAEFTVNVMIPASAVDFDKAVNSYAIQTETAASPMTSYTETINATLKVEVQDISITKTSDKQVYGCNDTVTYTIAVTNNSKTHDATGVTVIDILPSTGNLSYQSCSITGSVYNTYDNTLTVQLPDIPMIPTDSDGNATGLADTVKFTVTMIPVGIGNNIINTAIVSMDQDEPDRTNNTASCAIDIIATIHIRQVLLPEEGQISLPSGLEIVWTGYMTLNGFNSTDPGTLIAQENITTISERDVNPQDFSTYVLNAETGDQYKVTGNIPQYFHYVGSLVTYSETDLPHLASDMNTDSTILVDYTSHTEAWVTVYFRASTDNPKDNEAIDATNEFGSIEATS